VTVCLEPILLNDPEDRDSAQGSERRQGPPRDDDVSLLDAVGEHGAHDRRPRGPSDRADAGADAVQRAQHVEARRGVGQQDDAAGEGEDGRGELGHHERKDGRVLERLRHEHDKGRHEVQERQEDRGDLETVEGAVALGRGREDEELDEHPDDADEGVEHADRLGVCT